MRLLFRSIQVALCAVPLLFAGGAWRCPSLSAETAPPAAEDDATPLHQAEAALAAGMTGRALERSVRALGQNPLGGEENLQMALALFWAGHHADAARYARRAALSDPGLFRSGPPLRERMPARQAAVRLIDLAEKAVDEADADLCFLAGGLLLLDRDESRAAVFLIRAEELAGTDDRIRDLLGSTDADEGRNQRRGAASLAAGRYEEALRCFGFAAMDRPAGRERAAALAGMAVCLAALDDDRSAVALFGGVAPKDQAEATGLLAVPAQRAGGEAADAARRLQAGAETERRLAALLFAAAACYDSARECAVALLKENRADPMALALLRWMEKNGLTGEAHGPTDVARPGETPPAPDAAEALAEARRALRLGAYDEALAVLDPLVDEAQTEGEVFWLLTIAFVGRADLASARAAFELWAGLGAVEGDAPEMLLGEVIFSGWKAVLEEALKAAPTAADPNLLLAWVELVEGNPSRASDLLAMALLADPESRAALALAKRLAERMESATPPDSGDSETSPPGDADALLAESSAQFRAGEYETARDLALLAAEADPERPGLAAVLARCCFACADFDAAATWAAAALDETAAVSGFSLELKEAYGTRADLDAHLDALLAACENRPLNAPLRLLLGLANWSAGEAHAAAESLQEWSDLAPGKRSQKALDLLALARQRADRDG